MPFVRHYNSGQRMAGVTLLEVLVALAACAMLVTLLLPSIVSELRRVQLSRLQAQAVLVASQQIELLGVWPAVEPKPREGVEGRLRWVVRQVKVDAPGADGGAPATLRHFRITVNGEDVSSPLVDVVVRRLGELTEDSPSSGPRR